MGHSVSNNQYNNIHLTLNTTVATTFCLPQHLSVRMGPRWRLLVIILVYLLYLFLGATIFSAIEHPIERDMIKDLEEERSKFLKENSCVQESALDQYISSVTRDSKRGVTLEAKNIPNWSFGQSFFFSGTVITTIGYGQQTPLSTPGKLFCMFYALIGIPFTLLLLSVSVEKVLIPVNGLLGLMNSRYGHLYSPFHIRLMHLSLVGLSIFILFLIIPAVILDLMEPLWSWFDSFYYCFISLTTVGLGDFIPGDEPDQEARSVYKTGVTLYLVLGLMGVMTMVNLVSNIPELDMTVWFRSDYDTEEDPERQRLQIPGAGQLYQTGQNNSHHLASTKKNERRVIRAKSRRDDDEYDVTEEISPGYGGE